MIDLTSNDWPPCRPPPRNIIANKNPFVEETFMWSYEKAKIYLTIGTKMSKNNYIEPYWNDMNDKIKYGHF